MSPRPATSVSIVRSGRDLRRPGFLTKSPPVADDPRREHQVLDRVGLVALAPRARRRRHREDALLGGRRRAPAAAAGPAPPARPGRPVDAARRQPRPLRQLLEAGILLPQP